MVTKDMKAVKDFLWEKNNAGELNIDKLCIVGAEMGASVAVDFAEYDAVGYDNRTPFYGPLKLGQFVKMLVLISPKWSISGLPLSHAINNPYVKNDIALLMLVGKEDSNAWKETKRIHDIFEKTHREPTGDDKLDKQTLVMLLFDTSLQGTKLLDPTSGIRIEFYSKADGNKKFPAEVTAQDLIVDYINRRLVKSPESKDWGWKDASSRTSDAMDAPRNPDGSLTTAGKSEPIADLFQVLAKQVCMTMPVIDNTPDAGRTRQSASHWIPC